jgi:ATP-dependent Lhr-like helicase
VAGLRKLMGGALRLKRRPHGLRAVTGTRGYVGRGTGRYLPVGRWALWRPDTERTTREERDEAMARQLLVRYGVVFRELCARERRAPSWRILVNLYRRWEAQQEIRGGRFVSGFVGEQFALPEAIEALRAVRRSRSEHEVVIVSAADPTNLVGIVAPGERISARSGHVIAYRNGEVLDTGPLGDVRSRLRASGDLPAHAAARPRVV